MNEPQSIEAPWPNQKPVVDGIVPVSEVSQDPTLFDDLEDEEVQA